MEKPVCDTNCFDSKAYVPPNTLKDLEGQQFSLFTQSCWTLCDPMDCSTPGFPVHHQTPRACTNSCPSSQWCHPTLSSSVIPFSCLQSFPASGYFPVSQFFTSSGQSIGVSASASVLPMYIKDWFPLEATTVYLKYRPTCMPRDLHQERSWLWK